MKQETLDKYKHLLVVPTGSSEDAYWEAAGKFNNAICWEERETYRLIKKTGGRKCSNPTSSVDCDKVTDINTKKYYDTVVGAGRAGQSAGFSEQVGLVDPVDWIDPVEPGSVVVPPVGNTVSYVSYEGDDYWNNKVGKLITFDYYRRPQQLDSMVSVWFARTMHDARMERNSVTGKIYTIDESVTKHRAEWCAALGVPVTAIPLNLDTQIAELKRVHGL